jgi:predicted acyltransferase
LSSYSSSIAETLVAVDDENDFKDDENVALEVVVVVVVVVDCIRDDTRQRRQETLTEFHFKKDLDDSCRNFMSAVFGSVLYLIIILYCWLIYSWMCKVDDKKILTNCK